MANIAKLTLKLNANELERKLEDVTTGIVAKYIRKKNDEFIAKLIKEVGEPAAAGAFGMAIQFTTERIRNGYKFVANGDAIGFLEFGAGVYTDTGHHFAKNAPFEVKPGSWSKDHAQEFYKYGEWQFGGRTYQGVHAKRGLYRAYSDMLKEVTRVATEVFNK